jgi:cation diffusion facilitator family transporter
MSHEHHHDHTHYHHHSNQRSTQIVVFISAITMLLELYFGYKSNSVALLIEGWHMLSHVLVLILAWLAYFYIIQKRGVLTHKMEHRILALSSFASSIVLLVVTLVMVVESIQKFFQLEVDVSLEALVVAVVGLGVNGASAYFLHREEEKMDTNLRAAYIHVLSDVVLSVLAIISLFAAKYFGWYILDPICGLIGSVIIIKWAAELIRKSWADIVLRS